MSVGDQVAEIFCIPHQLSKNRLSRTAEGRALRVGPYMLTWVNTEKTLRQKYYADIFCSRFPSSIRHEYVLDLDLEIAEHVKNGHAWICVLPQSVFIHLSF